MTQKFKFFRGFIGTINTMNGETYATASFYDPRTLTEDERLTRVNERIARAEEFRNQEIITHEQYMRNRDMMIEQERIRRLQMINNSRDLNDNPIRLYQATRVTTVNPKWWMKVKIVLQETWRMEPVGVVVVSILLTMVTIIGIAKILSIW